MLVALDGGEPHLAVQLLHLLDAEVAELVVVALDEAERLVRAVELEQPSVPSVHAREVVGVDRGVLRPVLLVEPWSRLGDFLGHQLLHVFLRSGHVALRLSPLCAEAKRCVGGACFCSCRSRTGAERGQGGPRQSPPFVSKRRIVGDSVGPLEAAQWRCNPAAEPWLFLGGCRIVADATFYLLLSS